MKFRVEVFRLFFLFFVMLNGLEAAGIGAEWADIAAAKLRLCCAFAVREGS